MLFIIAIVLLIIFAGILIYEFRKQYYGKIKDISRNDWIEDENEL